MAYEAKTRNVVEHAQIPIARFDQKADDFRYNAVLRPALFRAAGFFVGEYGDRIRISPRRFQSKRQMAETGKCVSCPRIR
jgi:hypothetical protein